MNKQKPNKSSAAKPTSSKTEYYLGLDCGTSSVGWAVTDKKYNLLRRRGKTLWGVRLFDEAKTAADRRLARSSRRRLARRKQRIKLLQNLFKQEINKIDPDFFRRLHESFFWEEDKVFYQNQDKNLAARSKNTLFNDKNFTDQDFHKKFPTIWHLRNEIIQSADNKNKHFDIRLYYLAVEHILKHRGHFLHKGELHGAGDFSELWQDLTGAAEKCNFSLNADKKIEVEELLKQKISKIDKKKQLASTLFCVDKNEDFSGDSKELAALLVGGKANLAKLFGAEVDVDEEKELKLSLSEDNSEEKFPKIEPFLNSIDGGTDLILAAKQIYDYIYLSNLLRSNNTTTRTASRTASQKSDTLSAAMVRNYKQHTQDLKQIKLALKPFPGEYKYFFQTKETDNKTVKPGNIFYAAYIGAAYIKDKNGRKSAYTVPQEDINKELEAIFTRCRLSGDLLARAEARELLPKQRGFAKGAIPEQLHHNELKIILAKLAQDFPSFAKTTPGEPEKYNTSCKKIEFLHSFRIPYYCGPMAPENASPSQFSWAEPLNSVVYPWNYTEKVNLSARADVFIKRITNKCTYVLGADVLPKHSLLYERYLVLNELNNLKINGKRINQELKIKIYQDGFLSGELHGNVSLKQLASWLKTKGLISKDDELGGTNELKVLPRLSTHTDFLRILGEKYYKEYKSDTLEQAVELITILNNEPEMLAQKLRGLLSCTDKQAERLSHLNYKEWGRFSKEFLTEIFADINTKDAKGKRLSIIEALEETPNNLMELLGGEFDFKTALDEKNHQNQAQKIHQLSYENVSNLYCSPAVKRSVWQTIKIVQELQQVIGCAPARIFLEVTRGEERGEKKIKLARRQDLIEKYKQIKTEEAKTLLGILEENHDDRDLQSKKLFLYYQQMGKCAYCGRPISFEEINNHELCDIDHIFPRSKTKDDSITKNLVLVHAEENREKTNTYPISDTIRSKMHGTWAYWLSQGLITKEKYNRLTRANPLTLDELAGFISRQIVETSQSVKAIRDLLQENLPNTKIILVKAGNVSDLRHRYSQGEPRYNIPQMPEFIKIRELNDLHHAKDAYLNIVVGNVLSGTFTDNPYKWLKQKEDKGELEKYSIRTELLLRGSEIYRNKNGEERSYPFVKNWHFADSLQTVSRIMQRNDILWTKMSYEQSGAMSDLQIVAKADATEGIFPIKRGEKLAQTNKYGGYRSLSGAYFSLIEEANGSRRIVQVPIITKTNPEKFIKTKYPGSKIIISKIKFKSYLKINGFPCHLAGRTGNACLTHNAAQLVVDVKYSETLKNILRLSSKTKVDKNYIPDEHDCVSKDENEKIIKVLFQKLEAYRKMPEFGGKIAEICNSYEAFTGLPVQKQCIFITELLKVLHCNAEKGNLSSAVQQAVTVGLARIQAKLSDDSDYHLILQSPTGLYERKINLKTVTPGELK